MGINPINNISNNNKNTLCSYIISTLRRYNGGELYGNEFEEFYKKCDIARKKTTPYTCQQNGVA
jgi:hypothetical protein